ncbi:hypothetical protein Tco_1383827 [Tanacetum coccineum]
MSPVTAQQVTLDNALVAPEKRLKIEKCNARIKFSKPQREDTYQVTLDALKLSPCYPAFPITAEVPKVYMHQFWNTIKKIKDTDAYRFKLDKKKFRIDIEVFCEILQICPRLPNQDFVEPPPKEEMVPFIKELGNIGKCDMLYEIHTDHMHHPWRTFAAIINRCISRKPSRLDRLRPLRAQILWGYMINQAIKDSKAYKIYLDFATGKATPKKARKFKKVASPSKKLSPVLEEEPAKKPKQAKKPVKKSTTVPTTGVVIRDTPSVYVSKKKAPAKVDRGKGMYLHSDVALLEATQLKKAIKKSKHETHKLNAIGSGDGVDSRNDDSNDDDSDDVSNDDDDVVDSDADGDNEAKYEELYKDVNVRLKDVDHEEEGKGDAEITNAGRDDVSQEKSYEQVEDDALVTLTAAHVTQKTEGLMQRSFVSSDFASQFLNLDNVPPVDNEVISVMNVKFRHEEPNFSSLFRFDQRFSVLEKELSQLKQVDYSTQLLGIIKSQVPAMVDAQLSTRLKDSIQKAFQSYTTEFEKKTKKILLDKMQKSKSYRGAQEHKELYDGLVKSYKPDKDLFESYGKAYSLKRDCEDKDKDKDAPTGSDQGLKRRKTSKDVEPSKGSKSKELKSSSSKGTKSQPKSSGKFAQAEESVFETIDTKMPQNQGSDLGNTDDEPNVEAASERDRIIAQTEKPPLTFDELMSTPIDFSAYFMNNLKIDNLTQEYLVGPAFNLLKGTCRSRVELECHFEDYYKAITDQLDWNNPKGQEYPFDLSKPLPLIKDRGRQVVLVGYFINNDLEYLKGRSSSKKYTTYTTKTKVAKYDDIQGIEDMVLSSEISKRTPYTAYNNSKGIIYVDKYKRNRLMRSDELYKFSDGTLTSVRSVLLYIASNLRMDYLPKRRWSNLDKQRSCIMIKAIDKLQLERRLMRSLEKFIGGREYE